MKKKQMNEFYTRHERVGSGKFSVIKSLPERMITTVQARDLKHAARLLRLPENLVFEFKDDSVLS